MSSHPSAGCPDSVFLPSAAPHGFLIDMDGVIYRGSELIPGADRFIAELLALDLPFFFLTDNSQRTRRDMVVESIAALSAADLAGLTAREVA